MSGPPKLGPFTLESFFLQLIGRLEAIRTRADRRRSMRHEIRTLEFWRAIIAECLSTFFYVFLLCATHISWTGSVLAPQPNWLVMAMTSGCAMAALSQCFGHISGAHVNPAVTFALFVTSKISLLRALLYVVAQCGGSIAGAALLYGVSVSGHAGMGPLGISVAHDQLGQWQIFGVEFVLTFLVVLTIFATVDPNRKSLGSESLYIGISYLVCSLTGLPASGASMNPARSLGPSFVMNRWKHHWVYWVGPVTGGVLAGLIYEFIFDTKKSGQTLREVFDELEKEKVLREANTSYKVLIARPPQEDHMLHGQEKLVVESEKCESASRQTPSPEMTPRVNAAIVAKELESNADDDYEDPEPKNNKQVMMAPAYSTTSGTSSGSSSGHRSNQTQHSNVSVHEAPGHGHYDNFRTVATINSFSTAAVTDEVFSGTPTRRGHNQPSNNNYHHQANTNNYAGIYNYRHNALRALPSRMEYSNGISILGSGNTKF